MPAKIHTHTYERLNERQFGRAGWYRCSDPDCTHMIHKSVLVGKRTLCSICHENEFILSPYDLKLAQPRCSSCSQTKEAKAQRETKSALEQILAETTKEIEEIFKP